VREENDSNALKISTVNFFLFRYEDRQECLSYQDLRGKLQQSPSTCKTKLRTF